MDVKLVADVALVAEDEQTGLEVLERVFAA